MTQACTGLVRHCRKNIAKNVGGKLIFHCTFFARSLPWAARDGSALRVHTNNNNNKEYADIHLIQ